MSGQAEQNRQGFLFDPNRCTGCGACALACTIENGLAPGTSWRHIFSFNAAKLPRAPAFHLSLACNHCEDAPCLQQCPARAIYRDLETGTVQIHPKKCIGCKYCSWVCPYDAPRYDANLGIMGKCTLCSQRLRDGDRPACVELCPLNALEFGDLKKAQGEPPPGFPRDSVQPAIGFSVLRRSSFPGEKEEIEFPYLNIVLSRPTDGRLHLATEWPLLIFTLAIPLLVAWAIASLVSSVAFSLVGFFGLAAVSAGASLFHLGKPGRAFRALLHFRTSWLAREIALFLIFLLLTGFVNLFSLTNYLWIVAIVIIGFLLLYAVDRLYREASAISLLGNSAQVLPTGAVYIAVLSGYWVGALWLLFFRLLFFAYEVVRQQERPFGLSRELILFRILVGFFLPPILWHFFPEHSLLILLVLLAGDSVDRTRFYKGFIPRSPHYQIEVDLERMVRAG